MLSLRWEIYYSVSYFCIQILNTEITYAIFHILIYDLEIQVHISWVCVYLMISYYMYIGYNFLTSL